MAPNRLFIDPESNDLDLDLDRLLFEAKPIALILLVFGGAGVGFFVLARLFQYVPLFPQLFLFAQQFAFALGGFVALLYVLVRATQFAGGNGLEVGSTSSPSSPSSPSSSPDASPADGASSSSRYEIPVTDRSRTSDSDGTMSTEASDEDPSDDALDGDDGANNSDDDDSVGNSNGDDGTDNVLDDDDETDFVGENDDTDRR